MLRDVGLHDRGSVHEPSAPERSCRGGAAFAARLSPLPNAFERAEYAMEPKSPPRPGPDLVPDSLPKGPRDPDLLPDSLGPRDTDTPDSLPPADAARRVGNVEREPEPF
jgi:hypothetical protein